MSAPPDAVPDAPGVASNGAATRFVDVGGGAALHASALGPTDGNASAAPTLLALHSLGTDARLWHACVGRLAARRRCVAVDLPGHGRSSLGDGPATIARFAADLARLMDALGIERATLVGLSIGGLVAQRLALDAPSRVERLVLACTAARIGTPERYAARAQAVRARGLEAIADAQLERWFAPGFAAREPQAVAGVRRMLVGQDVAGYLAGCEALVEADLGAEVGRIAAPTLCLGGAEDGSTPPATVAALARSIPGAAFDAIEGAGHLPCLERPDAFAARVARFVASTGPAGATDGAGGARA